MSFVIGVDGGGTKTKAVLLDASKSVLGVCETGSTNPNRYLLMLSCVECLPPPPFDTSDASSLCLSGVYSFSVGVDVARTNLRDAILGACAAGSKTIQDVGAICCGISGCDTPANVVTYRSWVVQDTSVAEANVLIFNDSVSALSSGTLGKMHGIVAISGTGMIVCGMNGAQTVRSGGWGPMLGDGGSGFSIAIDILQAVCQAHDGRGMCYCITSVPVPWCFSRLDCASLTPPRICWRCAFTGPVTQLTAAVFAQLGISNHDDLIVWAYIDTAWARFAKLAPLAFDLYGTDEARTFQLFLSYGLLCICQVNHDNFCASCTCVELCL
jgi:N-acetylglucosamine kinase-like BadF-type ATPase